MSLINQQPQVSIITIVRNGADCIETTIKSVIDQSYQNIEYIIIDGKSTDSTIEIIQKYADRITHWNSEADRGISDAWNKGISACHGEIIAILNAGDTLPSDYVATIVNNIDTDRAVLLYGNVAKIDSAGRVIKTIIGNFTPHNLTDRVGFLHPGCFATRKAYDRVGLFDLKYRLAMDCDWLFRSYRAGIVFKKVALTAMMLEGGASSTSNLAACGEYLQAMRNNGFTPIEVYSSMLTIAVRGLVKSIVRNQ